ncbi:peptide-methionine (S)-S-oxide reductase MsrA [Flavobacterium sp. NG2]|uniref:peptide-methionine (S)-S-oxide reductase MsrA n=1 Tax=Flavobacterium sp. NG2 TaxID=3097547 RepID=UPI002A7F3BED|nr:peptide-methionine (S)-S-oxide reductase MsrA [Flavobacterium sp. NG2]WPR71256.1 peptide-methionine (S)-S-oxide reductase MsrA [Flavobacterium sp. NG2]
MSYTNQTEIAIIAGGCFWCTEAVFLELKGVVKVAPGYIGGVSPNPTYKEICTGQTGHAEAIQIEFDPKLISYAELLEVFFATHDPTTLNRQGNDVGTQYRSEIFYTNENQKKIAQDFIEWLNREEVFPNSIVTKISEASKFYVAEDYHHNYYNSNKEQGYCSFIISPKIEKVKKVFKDKLKE